MPSFCLFSRSLCICFLLNQIQLIHHLNPVPTIFFLLTSHHILLFSSYSILSVHYYMLMTFIKSFLSIYTFRFKLFLFMHRSFSLFSLSSFSVILFSFKYLKSTEYPECFLFFIIFHILLRFMLYYFAPIFTLCPITFLSYTHVLLLSFLYSVLFLFYPVVPLRSFPEQIDLLTFLLSLCSFIQTSVPFNLCFSLH